MKRLLKNKENSFDKDILWVNDNEYRRYYHNEIPTSYYVSAYGEVYSEISNKILKHSICRNGYHTIVLYQGKKRINTSVHQLVATVYIDPKPADNYQVDHKDGNKDNNHYSNLEWVTFTENIRRGWKLGLYKAKPGENNSMATYSDELVIKILIELKNGVNINDVCVNFNVNRNFIYRLLSGKTRQHLLEKVPLKLSDVNGARILLTPTLIEKIKRLKYDDKLSDNEIMELLKLKHISTIHNALKR